MDIEAAFVAHGKTPEAVEPGKSALDHPAVPAQHVAGANAALGHTGFDGALAAFLAATSAVIGLVIVQTAGPAPWTASSVAYRGNGIQCRRQHHAVVPVDRTWRDAKWRSLRLDHDMALRTRFSAHQGVRAGTYTPLLAAIEALSSEVRLQSS